MMMILPYSSHMKNESITQILTIPPFHSHNTRFGGPNAWRSAPGSRTPGKHPRVFSDFTRKPTVCYGKWTIDTVEIGVLPDFM
jgi:hypothetical protein